MDRNHEGALYPVDWTGYPMVETNPMKLSGTPLLKGSRMPAQWIIENYMQGDSADEIAIDFGLPKNNVHALIDAAVARNPKLLAQ